MAKLEDHHKQFIVEQLAEFRTAAEVGRLLKEEWGVEVDRFQVRTYDPSKPAYAGGDKWREIFEARRKGYLGRNEELPIANEQFRLHQMQNFFFKARDSGNMALALKILKQAEEASEKISARQPKENDRNSSYKHLTPDERRAAVAEMLREALGADRVPANYPSP
ncbi:MAG: DUF2280 domain-containing protein [Sphingobium sp.]|nr:DUF2280 domain-containing protein [Sphingobium sp.]MBP6112992.1 DUF2280 domain-containing protein [Sphingobium sp.]MBP8671794.1 DUF2280 domain-containing protein [Sphingobium sp.]